MSIEMKDFRKLASDVYNGVAGNFENGMTGNDVIVDMIKKACNGKTTIDFKDIRDGKVDFAVIEEVINTAIELGAAEDSAIWDFVDMKSGKLGDKPEFNVNSGNLFRVDTIADGTQGIRRQRLTSKSVTLTPETKAVKIYDELNRILAGRVDWATFVNRVALSFRKDMFNEVATMFNGITADTDFSKGAAAFNETDMIDLVTAVEDATGMKPVIFGSLQALRNLTMAMAGDEVKTDYYNMGYMGKWNGFSTFRVAGKNVDPKALFVIAGDDKFIKFYDEGDTLVIPREATANADLTQEYTVIRKYGTALAMANVVGKYTLS